MGRIVAVRLKSYLENVSPQSITPLPGVHELTAHRSLDSSSAHIASLWKTSSLRAEACAELMQELGR